MSRGDQGSIKQQEQWQRVILPACLGLVSESQMLQTETAGCAVLCGLDEDLISRAKYLCPLLIKLDWMMPSRSCGSI